MTLRMHVKDNIRRAKDSISRIKDLNGVGQEVKLIAVTKSATLDQAREAIEAGVDGVAESRVHFAEEKFPHLENVKKHMIGHLQRNKVKRAVELFDVIQSVDSLKLAKEIDKRSGEMGKVMEIMLQVNVSGEDQKFGFGEEEVEGAYREILALMNLKVIGIMVMAPFVSAEETREYFRKANEIKEKLKLRELSAGMSNDYEIAVEEGSTMVRLGRTLFD